MREWVVPFLHSCIRAAAASQSLLGGWAVWGWGGRNLELSAIITVRNVPYISLCMCRRSLFGFLLNKMNWRLEGKAGEMPWAFLGPDSCRFNGLFQSAPRHWPCTALLSAGRWICHAVPPRGQVSWLGWKAGITQITNSTFPTSRKE